MPNDLFTKLYNPDVLSCLANLSNDEVFTPPSIANQMLDMLPQEIFADPNTTFLDPACKSGVFLREIAKRLIAGLESVIPNLNERIDHIFHKQLFAIAITELTSLLSRRSTYCSKYPNGQYSVSRFDDVEGNIRFKKIQHVWKDNRCVFCGANKSQYSRNDALETHAYEFIHTIKPQEIFNMKFDVIIGNPPYQLSDGGHGASASPIYNYFVEQAMKLKPRYLSMIIPSRWFAGGKGLDSFRDTMLTNGHIKTMIDFPNAKECFQGISIGGGVCYFLWDRDYDGPCRFVNVSNGIRTELDRQLNEFDVFVRYNDAISIIHKVRAKKEPSVSSIISSRNPFGLSSATRGNTVKQASALALYSSQGLSYINRNLVPQGDEYIGKYKLMISKVTSEHAGEPDKNGQFKVLSKMQLLEPNEVSTDSYLIAGGYNSKKEAQNLQSYFNTKFARFLLLQAISSINLSKDKFYFIPLVDVSKPWTDEELDERYGLSDEEIAFIESMIRPME